jgi:putative ABC transport system substrate-binding protein
VVVRGQQPIPVIGFLSSRSANDSALQDAAFRRALNEAGYVDGQNVVIDYRWANGQYDQLPGMAADLIARKVAVIFAGGPAAHAAKAVTKTIPIVYVSGEDLVNSGLVASLNRPGGNITGVSTFNAVLGSKRFEMLGELVPNADVIAFLTNPISPIGGAETRETQTVARGLGRTLIVLNASTESEIEAAFAKLAQQRVGALDTLLCIPGRHMTVQSAVVLGARCRVRGETMPLPDSGEV